MNKKEIFNKYNKIYSSPGGGIYINISMLVKVVKDLYDNGFIVSVCEFLKINEKGTQPFMEYSLWKEGGYTQEEIFIEIDKINNKIVERGFQESEIYFDVLVCNEDKKT